MDGDGLGGLPGGSLPAALPRAPRATARRRIYVTENGASFSDGPAATGACTTSGASSFLRDHFAAARRAIEAGVPLAGYFVWSLLDNFEWDRGYSQRFGIVWVDYATQRRIPKDSALWYRGSSRRTRRGRLIGIGPLFVPESAGTLSWTETTRCP